MKFRPQFCGSLGVAFLLATNLLAGEPSVPNHGIVHFFEPKPYDAPPSDRNDPVVAGAEAIYWWGDLEPDEGAYDWSRVDQDIKTWQAAGKRLDVRLATAHNAPNMTPAWLFDRYHVRRIGRGHWCAAEDNLGVYALGENGRRTTNLTEVISGNVSIGTQDAALTDGVLLRLDHPDVLAPRQDYSLQFDYRSISGATGWVAVVNTATGFTNRVEFPAAPGVRGSYSFPFQTPDAAGSHIIWGSSSGQLSLDNLNLMPIQDVPAILFDGVESGLQYWKLNSIASITHDPELVLNGNASILISNSAPDFAVALMNNPATFPVLQGQGYSAGFRFKALSSSTIRLRLISHSPPFDILDEQVITLKAGDTGLHKWYYPAFVWRENTALEIGLVGPGQVVLDDLRWSRWSDRVTCFPDYFNPVFREKWERFITAFAARYANHPGVGRISVGGFGRWEEVILDDDVHGILDAQWLARGFTQEIYLQQVTWSMDLYRRLFPKKPLRICLAYGLNKQNDKDLIYRRVAQAAVARGIGLKQNGLSEKYDAWDDITSASYLFNRYRFHPDIALTYETGGQISRVAKHFSQGHPLSVLNRGMIDGTDYLFLYGSDINARHVHKYLGHVADLLGAPLLTTFYSRLGDYSLVMEHTPSPQEYRNQWLGLREFPTDGADPLLTLKNGEHCAVTRQGLPHIVFDVDDRQQYHGMFGAVFTVRYLDEGRDEFEVNGYDNFTRRWEKFGQVRKTGTGAWKMVSFQRPDWCRSSRGDGEDVHADLVINDLGDGIESIAGVELSFVPAREWQRKLIHSNDPGTNYISIKDKLVREITLPEGEPLNWMAVPVWSGGWQRNGLRGRVLALTDAGEVVASEKTYPMPADGDWFELPLTPVPGCRRYRIELSDPIGVVGWYQGADGSLAYRAWRYVAKAAAPAEISVPGGVFFADEPFVGIQIQLNAGQGTNALEAKLYRELAGGGWSAAIASQLPKINPSTNEATLYFEPQTAGRYKLELGSGNAVMNDAIRFSASPLYLVRLLESHPPRLRPAAPVLTLYDPSRFLSPVWTNLHSLSVIATNPATITARVVGPDCSFTAETVTPVVAQANQFIRLRLANHTGAAFARFFWAGAGQDFDASRSVLIPLVQNDTALRDYDFPVGFEDSWRGELTRFRIEPAAGCNAAGLIEMGPIQIVTF